MVLQLASNCAALRSQVHLTPPYIATPPHVAQHPDRLPISGANYCFTRLNCGQDLLHLSFLQQTYVQAATVLGALAIAEPSSAAGMLGDMMGKLSAAAPRLAAMRAPCTGEPPVSGNRGTCKGQCQVKPIQLELS